MTGRECKPGKSMGTEYIICKNKPRRRERPLIFVVDDDPIIRTSIEKFLKARDYKAFPIEDGYDVLVKLDEVLPDLIISDIRMEKLDGLTLLKALRNRSETSKIPVIFMTAFAEDKIIKQAKELGASFFLEKPFPLPSLIGLLKRILGK